MTGSGKTTVINLLMRFYDAQKGEVLLDGRDVRGYNLADLRRRISVVLQDVFLFSGNIADNVRLGRDDIDDDSVAESLRASGALPFVGGLRGGIYEPVAERGMTFSLGQRQLLSFARAVANEPAVYAFDEATANIDTETERTIQQSVARLSGNKTIIIVAHRLSTVRTCDVIFVLDKGVLRESGTHADLLSLGGVYARLNRTG